MRDLSALLYHGSGGNIFTIDPIDDLAVDTNGTGIALSAFEGPPSITIIAVVGPGAFTPTAANRLELELEESDDNSVYTDVANANLTRTSTPTAGGAATNTGCFAYIDAITRDDKLWTTTYLITDSDVTHIRVVANFTGTVTGGIPLAVFMATAWAADAPTAQ